MELREFWNIILRRKWIVLQALLIISLSAILGSYLVTPVYETSTKILITSSDTTSSLLSSIGMSEFSSLLGDSESEIDTYLEMATLNPILQEVIYRLQLRDKEGDLLKPDDFREHIPILSTLFPSPYVEVNEIGDADMIEITADSNDPLESAMIANTVGNLIIQDNLKYRREEYGNARRFIEEQLKRAKADYLTVLKDIESFMIEEKTVNIEEETKLGIRKMGELMKEKEDNIIDLAEVKAKIKTLKKQREIESVTTVSSSAIDENPHIESLKKLLSLYEVQLAGLLENEGMVANTFANETPQIESLKKALSDFKTNLAEMQNEKRPDHPEVKNLIAKIKTTKTELDKEIGNFKVALKQKIAKVKAELSKEIRIYKKSSGKLQSLERELSALEVHLVGVNADIEKYTLMLYAIPKKAAIQAQMQTRLTASQELYSALLEYLSEVGVAEAMTLSEIRLVEPAVVPDLDDPESPQKVLIITTSIFLGLIFGLGLAFLIDYIDDSIKTDDDVTGLGITLLGAIPKINKKESFFIHKREPKDPLSETYRTIRNNLKFASLDKPLNSLVITSTMEEEGKSTISVNLATAFARDMKKVLVIDADLRNPTIHKMLGLANAKGLTNILAGEATINETIIKTDIEGLSVITSGPVPPDPGHMVESDKMRKLTKDVIQEYDIVLFDSPPILVTNDAIVLSGNADAFIFILESRKITKRAINQAKEVFKQANVQPIGLLLNKYTEKRGGYYSYYYQYKSGYYDVKSK